MRGLFGHPSSLLDGERPPQGVAKRPPFPAEMPTFKCYIECDNCLPDPRLIDPSFSTCPAWPLSSADRSPSGPGWIHEVKLDGFRMMGAQPRRRACQIFCPCVGCPTKDSPRACQDGSSTG